jgi:hypothetical protein
LTTTQTEDPAALTAPETDGNEQHPNEPQDADALLSALREERAGRKAERSRAKAAEARADDLAERLTAAETARDDANTKISEITSARVHDLRVQVATDAGLDPKIAPRLTGSTREELEADASLFASAVVGGGGFDGGARKPAPMKPDPAKAHGRFIADLMNGGDGADLEENE